MRGISIRENREARRSPVGVDAAPPSWIAGWQVGARAGREGKAVGLVGYLWARAAFNRNPAPAS
jgi:hypothetical protein